jgi:hypothetical protein
VIWPDLVCASLLDLIGPKGSLDLYFVRADKSNLAY